MNINVNRKKGLIFLIIILIIIAVLSLLCVKIFFLDNYSREYASIYTKSDGTDAMVKVPEKTKLVDEYGLYVMKFESMLPEKEVISYYDDLFSSITPVRMNLEDKPKYYCDEQQGIVYSEPEITDSDGKTVFILGIDYCENIHAADSSYKPF